MKYWAFKGGFTSIKSLGEFGVGNFKLSCLGGGRMIFRDRVDETRQSFLEPLKTTVYVFIHFCADFSLKVSTMEILELVF